MRGALRISAIVVSVVGCRQLFGIHEAQLVDADVSDTSEIAPDAGPCQSIGATCASADMLRTCTMLGAQPTDTRCGWGCLDGGVTAAHCGQISPSGGGVQSADVTPGTMLGTVTIMGTVETATGAISGTTTRAAGTGPMSGIDYETRGINTGMFRANSFTLGATVLGGANAVAFVADGAIVVDGALDLEGACGATTAGPGGFAGGAAASNAPGPGGGRGVSNNGDGPGGGGYGGTGGAGVNGALGGMSFGDDPITVLLGGGGGGGGGDATHGGVGGGGGGAIQLVSNTSIHITALGSINAGGCGGTAGQSNASGGGGGAGGAILLEAPVITIDGVLAVNGGGGGGGYNGTNGTNGATSRTAAMGGTGGAGPGGPGGDGAAGAMLDGAVAAAGANKPGGSGGAVGRIRINTKTGTVTVTGTLSPALTDAPTTCSAAAAQVQ